MHERNGRSALGAHRGRVLRLVVGQMLSLTGVGIVLGLGGAMLVAQTLGTLLFNTSPSIPRRIFRSLSPWRASRHWPAFSRPAAHHASIP